VALPKFEDWKAPWELKDGVAVPEDEQVVDKAQLKKHLYNVLTDKEKAQVARDTNASKIGELTAQIETLKSAASASGGAADSSNPEIKKLMDLVTELTQKTANAELQAAKVTVLTTKGLDPVGDMAFFEKLSTAEEIEAMADKLVERGLAKKTDDQKVDDEGNPIVTKPTGPLNNGLPPNQDDGSLKVSVTDFLNGYQSGNPLF
jgi:hypothetical protein